MKRHVTKCYDTTKNLRRFGRVATVYVEMEMSHVYLPKVGKWLVQYFSRSEFFFFFHSTVLYLLIPQVYIICFQDESSSYQYRSELFKRG